jgi:hypothetical protein
VQHPTCSAPWLKPAAHRLMTRCATACQRHSDQPAACLSAADVSGVTGELSSKLELEIMEDMDAPVHIYYILNDFYQNHKRYVRSANYNQLHGKHVGRRALDICKPQDGYESVVAGDTLPDDGAINPCGLTAWSYFNDSFNNFEVRSQLQRT